MNDNNTINPLEDRLTELEKRITRLEKIENGRKIRSIIGLIIRLIICISLVFICYFAWQYINETIIEPYKETINEIQGVEEETENTLNEYIEEFTK